MADFFKDGGKRHQKMVASLQEGLNEIDTNWKALSPCLNRAIRAVRTIKCITFRNPAQMKQEELNDFIPTYKDNLAEIEKYTEQLKLYVKDVVITEELQLHLNTLEDKIKACARLVGLAKSFSPSCEETIKKDIHVLFELILASASIIEKANSEFKSDLATEYTSVDSIIFFKN